MSWPPNEDLGLERTFGPMTRNIFLHIGTEKTGTKTIQEFCSRNRDKLEIQELIYPRLGFADSAHFSLVAPLHPLDNNGRPLEFGTTECGSFDEEWGALAKLLRRQCDKDVLISAEHFSSRLKERGIAKIAEFFDSVNERDAVRVVVFLRRHDELVTSTFSTMVRYGAIQSFEETYAQAFEDRWRYDYAFLLDAWARFFGRDNLVVRVFEPEAMPGGLVKSFLEALGRKLTADVEVPDKRLNRSWSIETLHVARILNADPSMLQGRDRIAFLDSLDAVIRGTPVCHLLGHEKRWRLLQHYEESSRQVAREFLARNELFHSLPERGDPGLDVSSICNRTTEKLIKLLADRWSGSP
jgi:hypothetical protein